MTQKKPQPWERQKGEPNKAHNLFKEFLQLGKARTLKQLHEYLQETERKSRKNKEVTPNKKIPSYKTIQGYSAKYKWMERAGLYDDYIDHQRLLLQEQRIIDRQKQYLDIIEPQEEEALSNLLQNINAISDELKYPLDKIKPTSKAHAVKSLATSLDLYIKNIRLIYDLPTETQAREVNANVQSEGRVTQVNYNVDKTSDEFFDKQMEFIDHMIDEHDQKRKE